MKYFIIPSLILTTTAFAVDEVRPFISTHCIACHSGDTTEASLDLSNLTLNEAGLQQWVQVYDRVLAGEMPPSTETRPDPVEIKTAMAALARQLTTLDTVRQQRDGRSRLRRLNRVEFENTLRDLLALPALKLKESLPEDGRSHGFDRLSGALDMSFVHMESYLAAVDAALNEALCPFPDQPPVFQYRFRLTENIRKDGKECEGSVGLAIRNKTAIALVGMQRDKTFVADTAHHLTDEEPKANAIGLFRHEDADYRWTMTAIQPVISGFHKLRVSGYSFDWDGEKVVPTDRHGALGWGVFARGEHYGTVDLPPNKPAEREITAWLTRGGGMLHGTDDFLRLIAASCENFRDYAHGKNKDVLGPMSFAPGVAVEWVEIEGPLYDMWPPASHRVLFGDLPVKEWTKECEALAEFLNGMSTAKERDASLLEKTSDLYGTNMGSANSHANDNLPVLLAGGGFQHAGHLAFDRKKNYPLTNLYVSLLQKIGVETDRFSSGTTTMRGFS